MPRSSSSSSLGSSSKGARVRFEGGKRTVTDGPFAEAKELIAGFAIIDVKSKDEAIEWAAKCPGASYGSIEVRPVVDFSQPQ